MISLFVKSVIKSSVQLVNNHIYLLPVLYNKHKYT